MRRLMWLVALVAVKAFGYVDMPAPKVELIGPDRVLQACDGASSRGCTKIVEARLLCECVEEKGAWRLRASVRAVPRIYITGTNWLRHEMQHVWDFRHYLRAHVDALGRHELATPRECDALAKAASEAFPETMQRVGRLSGDRRDGKRLASSEDHLVVMQAEVMPQLVNDRLANLANHVPAAARNAENRTAKNRNLIGERGKHVEASLRQGDAPVDSKKFVVVRALSEDIAVFVSGLFFDDDNDVVEHPRKLVRQLFQSLFDELLEFQNA